MSVVVFMNICLHHAFHWTAVESYCLTNGIFRYLMSGSRNNCDEPVVTYIVRLWTVKTY
jgi:hypothetical protein